MAATPPGRDRAPQAGGSRRRANEKVRSRDRLLRALARAKRRGSRVVFTNGCFDVLHVGHVQLLTRARGLGDVLVVGINSDRSVRRLKGPGRPLMSQRDRAKIVAALGCVDYVTVFDASTPLSLIRAVRPNVLVKGEDWAARDIVGGDLVERAGGRVVRVPLVPGRSTTRLLARLGRAPNRKARALCSRLQAPGKGWCSDVPLAFA